MHNAGTPGMSASPGAAPTADTASPGVRCLTPVAQLLVREGTRGSPTFRALLREIDRTDVIVLVVTGKREPDDPSHGNLHLIGTGHVNRFLRVWVDSWYGTRREQVALLGHELHHALEIGQAPEARTVAGIAALYARIGQKVEERCYETRAAQNVGALVNAELGSPPPKVSALVREPAPK